MTTTTNKEGRLDNFLEDDDFLGRWVTWGLWALAIIVCIATVTGLVESYNGLYIWFATHHVTGFWADFAPLTVDSFTVIGELAIFAGISRHWDWKSRVIPWGSAMLGICSSVAGNVGDKVQYHSIPTDLTGAIFPLAGALGIIIGLGVLKRVAKDHTDKKARQRGVTISPEDVAAQLMKDNQDLVREMEKLRSTKVVDISPTDEELKSRAHYVREPVAGPDIKTMERINAELADKERRGLDVLIPPRPPVEETSTWTDIVQPVTSTIHGASAVEQAGVSREEARRRLTDLRPGRPIIDPKLDVRQTGAIPVLVE